MPHQDDLDEEELALPLPLRDSRPRAPPASASTPERRVKCVLVGDAGVGKTSLIISYTTNGYPTEHVPTAFDNFSARVEVDGRPVRFQLCDMAGQRWAAADQPLQDKFERLRPLCYRDADVFLLCYSTVLPSSLRSVMGRWAPEVQRLCPCTPLILVGTQCDLTQDVQVLIRLAENQEKPVSRLEARQCSRSIGALAFIECSALTQKNLKEVFDAAIMWSLRRREEVASPKIHALLREKTPDKIKLLSETWWKKLSCVQSFDIQ